MKRINLIISTVLFTIVLFSCQNKSTEKATNDTLTLDSVRALQDTINVSSAPTEAEIIEAESSMEEEEASSLDTRDFDYTYEGLLNNQIKVRVNIFKFRGEQKARLVYLSSKKIINMEVAYPKVGTFELTEKIDGKSTGIWKIAAEEEDILSGTWNSPDGKKELSVSLGMTNEDFDNFLPKGEIKTGFYELKQLNDDPETKEEFPLIYSEELYVKNMAGNTIYFDLYLQGAPPGVHLGMVSGFANKVGGSYVYKNDQGCEITMSFVGDAVALDQKGTDMNCEFGAGIGAFGTLKKRKE